MADELFEDNDAATSDSEAPMEPEAALPEASPEEVENYMPLDSVAEAQPEGAMDEAEVEDLFDFNSTQTQESEQPAEFDETAGEEPAARTPARKISYLWVGIAAAVTLNIGVAAMWLLRPQNGGPSADPKNIESKESVADAGDAKKQLAPVIPRDTPAAEPEPVEPPKAQTKHSEPTQQFEPEVPEPVPSLHPKLIAAQALFDGERYAEARRKYFEVLLSPIAQLEGRDSTAARLGIARCLALENAPASAPIRARASAPGSKP
jgi:hypothetical protein